MAGIGQLMKELIRISFLPWKASHCFQILCWYPMTLMCQFFTLAFQPNCLALLFCHHPNIWRRSVWKYDAGSYQQCNQGWGGYVVNIPIYSLFLHLFKLSITFLISFQLPLFRLYYLETMDIFPTFFPSNMLLI